VAGSYGKLPREGVVSQSEICFFGYRLTSLAPSITYHSCRDVAKLYSIGYIQETWLASDTAPVICRGFLFVRCVMPKGPKGEKRPADVIARDLIE
jgi:hypothetical protein